jgi:bisphosphoglycerate-independent phosphoglycerate mutase (AlkP superfamily)
MNYANKTSVPVDRSMSQVRQVLQKHKAQAVAIAETDEGAATKFVFEGKPYQFVIKYPAIVEERIALTSSGKKRTTAQALAEIEAEKRRLWRCMVLYIKAAIEAHANGLIDLKRSMVGHMLLPSGKTFYSEIEHNIEKFEANPRFMLEQP